MVKIAIAGGSSEVAHEIIDAIVSTKMHKLLLLSRKDVPAKETSLTWVKADYESVQKLVEILQGVHTVLSFVTPQSDPGNTTQKNLIDAAVKAGVKRFAPSEWTLSSFEHLSWYAGKGEIREYLRELNKDRKVLEYTLFQPGLFVNYFTYPYQSSKHIHLFETPFDFHKRRALIPEGGEDAKITLTTSQDLANIVARAIEYKGEWPVVGGIKGDELSISQIIALGERIRGGPFDVERLKTEDLNAEKVGSSWMPKVNHPAIPAEVAEKWAPIALAGMLLAFSAGVFSVSEEWNQLLPDYQFARAEGFLADAWRDRP